MEKVLIIGLDLSFNSTGICISYLEDKIAKNLSFHRIKFDDESNKTGKKYTPNTIKNVNDIIYRMPTNLLTEDLVLDLEDKNNYEQCHLTLKSIICSKKISLLINENIIKYSPDKIIFSFENYVMPSYEGPTQLKSVSGLITLQGHVRKDSIQLCLQNNVKVQIYTPTPSSNKLFFTKDGNADKLKMLVFFIKYYDGNKLLPTVTIDDVGKVNDIIDAFSLMMNAFSKYKNN